jgi:phage/conjugal plasmid C-4 type zinc finger TraR family protein
LAGFNRLKIEGGLGQEELIMAGGWTRDGNVQDQIDATVEDAVRLARSRLPEGEAATHCEECGTQIPDARRKAIPGVRLCVGCQSECEKRQTTPTGFNRRGSKDSQLK